MKFAVTIVSGSLQKRLARLLAGLEPAVLDAAADALAKELETARRSELLHAPLLRQSDARGRSVGANDLESITRELGSPTEPPAPWLAPVLPAARARMRRTAFAACRIRDKPMAAAHTGNVKTPMRAALTQAVARALLSLSSRARRSA